MREAIGGHDERSQWQWWAAQEDPRLEFRNHGVSGERADEIARRFDAAADGVEVLLVQGGTNDIVQGREVEPATEQLHGLVRRAKERGLRVLLTDVLPWNNGWPDAEPKIRRLNELIRAIGDEEDVPVLPFHDTLEDPDRPGRMRAEWTTDLNHPNVEGYRQLGERAFRLP